MIKKESKNLMRIKRHRKIRQNLSGTETAPRLCVFRSNSAIYAQIIDDVNAVTLVAASSVEKDFSANGGNKEGAKLVGELVAKKALDKGITEVVFDRGGYVYHGRVQQLAESAREAGLKF